ncbi:MAG: fructose-bisphosphate aldolase [Chloroflexi bacterium]|nr:fructose-bisphosphate aldolase [Chloroflexota bacterium]
MDKQRLVQTAQALVAEGKGILAADESSGTIKRRFDGINTESTEDSRRNYREMLFRTAGVSEFISGVILFDGSDFDEWRPPTGWEILGDEIMMVKPKGKDLVSKNTYKDVKVHVEFRTPYMPRARGQERGNSGVFMQDVYEAQVLDSYGLEGYYNECGGLYKLSAPRVNSCAPPLQWQTYDIDYVAPRYDASDKLKANGRITVYLNGVLVQDYIELEWITAWTEAGRLKAPPRDPGHIILQAHNNYVQFRNIWLVER